MDYLEHHHKNTTEQKVFFYRESVRKRFLNFGYCVVIHKNKIKKSLAITKKLIVSSHL